MTLGEVLFCAMLSLLPLFLIWAVFIALNTKLIGSPDPDGNSKGSPFYRGSFDTHKGICKITIMLHIPVIPFALNLPLMGVSAGFYAIFSLFLAGCYAFDNVLRDDYDQDLFRGGIGAYILFWGR